MAAKKSWYADYVHQVDNPYAGIAPEVIELLRAELAEGEEILWFEQPSARSLWRVNFIFTTLSPLVLAFGAFAMAINPFLRGNVDNINWVQWMVFSVLLFTLISQPLFLTRIARKSLYILTVQKAIHISPAGAKCYYMHQQIHRGTITVIEYKNGKGDLIFGTEITENNVPKRISFLGIHEVVKVKQLFDQALFTNAEDHVAILPLKVQPAIKAELLDGEKVLWSGQPNQYWIMNHETGDQRTLRFLIFLIWGVFAFVSFLLILGGATSDKNKILFYLGIGLFVLSSIMGLVFFIRVNIRGTKIYNEANKITYLLTNQRIMQITNLSSKEEKVESFYFSEQSRKERITLVRHSDNTGNIYLTPDGKSTITARPDMKLIGVWEPGKVEQLIRQQLASY